ncbi:hypothetical protein METBIDRAFT_80041 [Metschnikowia bicuspidata var. bicuspidata NRRL YB-4993]|uniref:Vph2p n=1 Tax=Metschnikowia bicuspidata var. bicuspidata NRRL YB-4993 TaxID=869754 RepID=A0A1A0H4U4_9ASCO|nr:hypothetical protein METBIDRAFT_80041 [Metschnikowia bicuspidata var. bicuspidata NRRL YB-4993]OBA19099.1 hypothetical protein METBIDRAFT_80041 [Metschnikowia bicuspidata var. bicuspidata NRRL YB-4993]
MAKFRLTRELANIIQDSGLSTTEKDHVLAKDTIDHVFLVEFYRTYRPRASMLELLQTTQLVILDKNPRNENETKPELFVKLMEDLRLRNKEEEYQKLVNPSPTLNTLYEQKYHDEPFNSVRQHKETKTHITTMFNILISVASVVYAIWYWTDSSWGIRDSYRVLLCIFFGILILVAEVVVYMGYLRRIEEAKIKERNKKELKKVVRSFTVN